MVHIKVRIGLLETLPGIPRDHLYRTLCGRHTTWDATRDDDYRHIPPCPDDQKCASLVVDCTACKGVYDAIIATAS